MPAQIKREIISVRELAKEELGQLYTPRRITTVGKLRDSHHRLAFLFAVGHTMKEVAEIVGYSYHRVRYIRNSPAFDQLVADIRKDVMAEQIAQVDLFASTQSSNMVRASLMLSDHLEAAEETGELLPVRELVSIIADSADRFGYPKKGVNVNVNADFGALLEARLRKQRESAPPVSPALELSAEGSDRSSPAVTPLLIQRRA